MTETPPEIQILLRGAPALTVEMIAERWGITPKSVSVAIWRHRLEHDGMLDGKKKIYLESAIDAVPRRGKGWRGLLATPDA